MFLSNGILLLMLFQIWCDCSIVVHCRLNLFVLQTRVEARVTSLAPTNVRPCQPRVVRPTAAYNVRVNQASWDTPTRSARVRRSRAIDRSITLTIDLNNNRFNHKHWHVPYYQQQHCGKIRTVTKHKKLHVHGLWSSMFRNIGSVLYS